MTRHGVLMTGTSAMERQWYEQFRKKQKEGTNLTQIRTFIGRDGEICETRLPITEKTVFVDSSVLDERAREAATKRHEDDLARAQRGLATRSANTTLSTAAGVAVDVKV